MERKIIITSDGSTTIHLPQWNEQYHSKHGAINEAYHVFINKGLHFFASESHENNISILEIGFGTGLNAFITFLEAKKHEYTIDYVGVEAYPVTKEEVAKLNYVEQLNAQTHQDVFTKMHEVGWGEPCQVSEEIKLTKRQQFFKDIDDTNAFDIIYFDAFGARVQPELWSKAIFQKMYDALKINGVLVTYAAIGSVRRAMKEIGFKVERLDGPPNKRHMLRAIKIQ